MINKESSSLYDFESLSSLAKVWAILGAVVEPVTKEDALRLSGVDSLTLDEKTKSRIKILLNSSSSEISEVNGVKYYESSYISRLILKAVVNLDSVNAHINTFKNA